MRFSFTFLIVIAASALFPALNFAQGVHSTRAAAGNEISSAVRMPSLPQTKPENIPLPVEAAFPSLRGATTWLNSQPLTPEALRGKVVMVEFWTYTCINWRRQFPYVRAWAQKYKDQGLVVIGVHAPEFSFEKNIDNVRQAAHEIGVDFPIAVDNDHTIWSAFNNEYWPALYFIDAQGKIRHHQFGEGDYEQSELVLQQLLAEAGIVGISHDLVSSIPRALKWAPTGRI